MAVAITDVMLLLGRFDDVIAGLTKDFKADPAGTERVLHLAISRALNAERVEAAEQFIAILATKPDGKPEDTTVYHAELDLVRGDPEKAVERLEGLMEGDNVQAMHRVFTALSRRTQMKPGGDRATIDKLCMVVLLKKDSPDALRRAAVDRYCAILGGKDVTANPARLTELLEMGIAPPLLRGSISRNFKYLLKGGDDVVKATIVITERLAALEKDEAAKKRYLAMAQECHLALSDSEKAGTP